MHTTAGTLRFGRDPRDARAALILIHGRGSAPEDIAALTEKLDAPDVAMLAPRASNGSWYPQRFLAPLQDNEPWLGAALGVLDTLVGELVDTGVAAERIGLIGFSQGACLALEHAAQSRRRHGFIASLSGALIGPIDTVRPPRDLGNSPILLGCAEADAHIPLPFVEHSVHTLEAMNAKVTRQIYSGSAHRVFPEEIEWINRQLASLLR